MDENLERSVYMKKELGVRMYSRNKPCDENDVSTQFHLRACFKSASNWSVIGNAPSPGRRVTGRDRGSRRGSCVRCTPESIPDGGPSREDRRVEDQASRAARIWNLVPADTSSARG